MTTNDINDFQRSLEEENMELIRPVVTVKNGEVFTNSRDVAAFFYKRHDNVMQAIGTLIASEPRLGLLNFKETKYVEPSNGQTYKSYDLDRDGFSLLAMGFTGGKALKWKMRYIEAFNTMEAALRNRQSNAIPDLSDPAVLIQLLTEHASKRIEAERRADVAERSVEEARPKTKFYDTFMSADGLYGLQNAARVLNEPPNKFISYLKRNDYLFYQGASLVPYAEHKKKRIFEVKTTIIDDKARHQTFITPKGITYFAEKLRGKADLFGSDYSK